MSSIELKNRIMRRVYAVWAWRQVTSPLGLEILSMSAMAVWLLSLVSVKNIFVNAFAVLRTPSTAINFFISIFTHTETAPILLTAGMAIVFGLLVKDLAKMRFTLSPL